MSNTKRNYEGMFLLDSSVADFQAASEPIRNVLDRNEAETLAIKPWDDRRLAYEIKGRKRGLYVLTYFNAEPARIVAMEHDCRLDERILRVLFLKKERLGEDELAAKTPGEAMLREEPKPAQEETPAEVAPSAAPVEEQPPAETEPAKPAEPAPSAAPVEEQPPVETEPAKPAEPAEDNEQDLPEDPVEPSAKPA